MARTVHSLPPMSFDAIRADKLRRLTIKVFRLRLFGLGPLVLLLAVPFSLLDLEPWRMWGLGAFGVAVLSLFVYDQRRAQRIAITPPFFRRYLPGVVLVQLTGIGLTGGLFSPLLPIFLPIMWAAGTVNTGMRGASITPAVATVGVVALAFGHLTGALPPIPAIVPPASEWVVVFLHAAVITLMCWALTLFAREASRLYEEIERELDHARKEAVEAHEERLRSLEALSRRVAHEIKNPLAAIKGLTQLLQRRGDPTGHLTVIASEVERLQEILDGFLSFSRSLDELRTGPVDLRALAVEVLDVLEMRLAQARSLARLEGDAVVIEADAGRLKQVLMNLLLNAIEALEALPPERARNITVRIERLGDGARVVVTDTGPGLGATEVERLFQPSVSGKERGTGLGLPISRAIARAHGGDVRLEALGGTTRAVLTLPLAAPPAGHHPEVP